ncbi:MAG: M23 family metallopeptidase [Deltaproteobacteria bacterium]|nr:M23 family metallopeptidase [Deltaproteobacteria bacterium]
MKGTGCFFALLQALLLLAWARPCVAEVKLHSLPHQPRQGEAFLLQVLSDSPLGSVTGSWRNRTIHFFPGPDRRRFEAILGVDLAQAPGRSLVRVEIRTTGGDRRSLRTPLDVLPVDFPVQRLTLPRRMVTLSRKTLDRVMREKARVSRLFQDLDTKKRWGAGFMPPLQGAVLSPFGARRILNGEPRSPHSGVDLKASEGTPVRASSDGIVALVAEHYFAGKSVYLDHGGGIVSMYFHLSQVRVRQDDRIRKGEVIGLVGKTGRATGPHLHWGVRVAGSRVDPFSVVKIFREEALR